MFYLCCAKVVRYHAAAQKHAITITTAATTLPCGNRVGGDPTIVCPFPPLSRGRAAAQAQSSAQSPRRLGLGWPARLPHPREDSERMKIVGFA